MLSVLLLQFGCGTGGRLMSSSHPVNRGMAIRKWRIEGLSVRGDVAAIALCNLPSLRFQALDSIPRCVSHLDRGIPGQAEKWSHPRR